MPRNGLFVKMNRNAWISKQTAAAILGLGESWFDRQIRPRLHPDAIKTEGKSIRFDGAAVVKYWIEYQREQNAPAQTNAGDDPEIFSGGNSPELEKLRAVKRQLAEHELAVKRGEVVDVTEIAPKCFRIADIHRSAWERAEKVGGKQIGEIGQEAVDESIELIRREFFSNPRIDGSDAVEDGGSEQAETPANDPPVR